MILSHDPVEEKFMKISVESDLPFTYNGVQFFGIKWLFNTLEERVKPDMVFANVLRGIARHDDFYEFSSEETKTGEPYSVYFDKDTDIQDRLNDVLMARIYFLGRR